MACWRLLPWKKRYSRFSDLPRIHSRSWHSFMRSEDILELIANGENSGVEFQRADVGLRAEEVARAIVALVNFQGGLVLLGVEDDGTISGIQRLDLEHWVMDSVFGKHVHPRIRPFYEEVVMPDDKRVAVISVTQGISKPYVLRHDGREDVYVRVGGTSQRITREQLARLFGRGGMLHAELLPVSGTLMLGLDPVRLVQYLINFTGDDVPPRQRGCMAGAPYRSWVDDDTRRQYSSLHYCRSGAVWPLAGHCLGEGWHTLDLICG